MLLHSQSLMKLPLVQHKTVLITGCSTGIGATTALTLKERGWHVIPTARKTEDLEGLSRVGFDPVEMDMADPDSVAAGCESALSQVDGKLGALVNNAGFGQSGALEDLSREHIRYQFEVNVFGLQDLTNRLIPTFRRQGYGRIVHISSVVGRLSVPYLGTYSASKFAVEALADAQRVELFDSGVGVILVEPGPIITEFRRNAARRASETLNFDDSPNGWMYREELDRRAAQQKSPDWINKSPEDVAIKIVHALESPRPKRRYRITIPTYAGEFLRRYVPAAIIDGLLVRKAKQKRAAGESQRVTASEE